MVSKHKILFVFHCSIIGGGSWCLYEILKHLDLHRFDPVVLLNEEGPLVARIQELNIPVIVDSKIPVFPVYAGGGLRGGIRLIRNMINYFRGQSVFFQYCQEMAPEVLYLNSSAQLFLPPIAKKAGIKKVIYHNREHWDAVGVFKIKFVMRDWIIKRFVDQVLSITACGAHSIGFPEKTRVVRDWPSFDDESEADIRGKLGIDPNQFLILLTGGFFLIKGTLDLLQAVEVMQYKNKVAVVVLGCSDGLSSGWKGFVKKKIRHVSYADKIKKMADKLDQLYLLPPTLQVKAYMQACDVLVAPFIMPHAAKAALEAQLLGHPVIIYNSEEAREYVVHEETGLIISHGKINELANALDQLVGNPDMVMKMGQQGQIFVQNNFCKNKSMELLMNFFG